jgi:glucose/mannose transport system substrate-binding protein
MIKLTGRMRSTAVAVFALGPPLAIACSGCSQSGPGQAPAPPKHLEVFDWFTASSELDAINALFDQVSSQHPDIPRSNIVTPALTDAWSAQSTLAMRMAEGKPPDSFQVVSGSDLGAWIKKGALAPLTDIALSQGWGGVMPVEVLQSVSDLTGVLYGVPLDIERDNTIFYNKSLVPTMPTTLDAILALATKLKTSLPAGITPFAVSASEGWTMASHVFESVLVAQAGAEFYQSYLTGQKQPDDPAITTALTTTGQMLDMSNTDAPTTGWSDAVKKVCMGQAAMLVLPDFVKGEFGAVGCGPDMIGYVPMQTSTESAFIFVSVTFALPNGAPDTDAAKEFLETVGSTQGQLVFNQKKGALPARRDANITTAMYDSISLQTYADFTSNSEHLVPAYAALTSPAFQTAVNTGLQAFSDRTNPAYKNVPTMVNVLKANYSQINQ